ncbi:MAG: ABC transporter ATP-binding protein [Candidatus Omnitrophica bacterium]|nr:ABC transporter ATP-binding protein [Candidatus Omnitrophota bacterium]
MLLELKNISKNFPVKTGFSSASRDIVRAVNQVSLDINEGESISLVGESGCGKTTLARIIMQLIRPYSGEIIYDGHKVDKSYLPTYRKNVQMVFQDPYSSLDPRYTIRRIIDEGMILDKTRYKSQQEREIRIQQMLKAVYLTQDMLNRYPHEFSGGERQRIAIARALVLNPKLLILDEAVSSLDVLVQEEILKLLADLQKQFNLTYIFISHNLKVVKKISQRVAVMYKGRIVELATTDRIFTNPLHPYTQDLLSAAVHYKVAPRSLEIHIPPESKLIEQEKGHFVIGK